MNKDEADLILAEQNKSREEILKAVAKVKSDYHELCKMKDMRIAELEKENAELKGLKDVAVLIKANNDTVITLMQLNNMLVRKSQHLIKAKELLKSALDKIDCVEHSIWWDKAEKFLKESE